ncbi:phosphotransferase enzyme family protein [Hypoxylon sp. NC1633]|nr:phosphotransferase enzyme family protein [Hypoxylon sp. NC1633]
MAGSVRHPIDTQALERYITQNVPEIKVPLDVKQFGFGQSNPTYQLTSADGTRYVLRKKPAGKLVSQSAHKVEREYRVISALRSSRVPVPRAYALCEDVRVLGTPFYVMSFIDGRIHEDPAMPTVSSPDERAALWRVAVEALAALHSVDPDAVGLGAFGRRAGFYDRQIATWRQICDAQARVTDADTGEPVGPIPHMDDLMAFFGDAALRPRDRGTLVHGDYKIDNVVFAALGDEPRVAGLLDWEMSTIGHPLSDLANLLNPYVTAPLSSGPSGDSSRDAVSAVSHPGFLPGATAGLPDPATVVRWYARAAGWDPRPEEVAWACAFSVFRSSAICQGIAARLARRQASSANARKHAAAMLPLGEYAWELVCKEREKRIPGVGNAKL